MGAGGVTTTIVTAGTSHTTSTEGTCHGIARRWHRVGLCSGCPGVIQNGGHPPGCRPHAGRGLCLAAWCAFLGHEFMAAGPWGPRAVTVTSGQARAHPASGCAAEALDVLVPWRQWQGSVWVPVPLGVSGPVSPHGRAGWQLPGHEGQLCGGSAWWSPAVPLCIVCTSAWHPLWVPPGLGQQQQQG